MAESVTRLGAIRNPRSLRNRLRQNGEMPKVDYLSGIEVIDIEPSSADDLPQAVAEMSRHGVNHLIVDGGDGTLRDVLSALPAAYGTQLPTLTLFASGNANLTSADVGTAGHGPEAMQALLHSLANADPGLRTTRQPIEVHWPDGSHEPVLGFFIGAAGFYRGWKLALGGVHQRGFMHSAAVMATVAAAAWQTLLGGHENEWQIGMPMDVAIDRAAASEGQRFLFLATSLHRLIGTLWPFFDHGDRSIRWLDVDAPPPRFARALPALLRGRPKDWMRDSGAYRSGGADHIELRLESPLVVDGEAFTPGAYGIVELRAGPEIEFYTPTPKP